MKESNICKSFNVFITKMILCASIDYKRKLFRANQFELEITPEIDNKISLSKTGKDIFCFIEEKVASHELEKVFELEEHYNAMKPLTNKEKEVIDLFVIKKLPVEEVAKIMGISESNVTTIKSRALERFRKNMKRGK